MRRAATLARRPRVAVAGAHAPSDTYVAMAPTHRLPRRSDQLLDRRTIMSFLQRLTGVTQRDAEIAELREQSAALRSELERVSQQLKVRGVIKEAAAACIRHIFALEHSRPYTPRVLTSHTCAHT